MIPKLQKSPFSPVKLSITFFFNGKNAAHKIVYVYFLIGSASNVDTEAYRYTYRYRCNYR